MRNRTTFRDLEVVLSDEELLNISRSITNIVIEIEAIEEQKKRIKDLRGSELYYSKIFKQGFETKSVRCSVVFNSPKDGSKTIIRNDTDTKVEVLEMTKDELQEDLPFNDAEDNNKIYELKENA